MNHVLFVSGLVQGCADPEPPPNAWLKRTGDRAEIGCDTTEQKWTLTCKGRLWEGNLGNCSQPTPGKSTISPVHTCTRLSHIAPIIANKYIPINILLVYSQDPLLPPETDVALATLAVPVNEIKIIT